MCGFEGKPKRATIFDTASENLHIIVYYITALPEAKVQWYTSFHWIDRLDSPRHAGDVCSSHNTKSCFFHLSDALFPFILSDDYRRRSVRRGFRSLPSTCFHHMKRKRKQIWILNQEDQGASIPWGITPSNSWLKSCAHTIIFLNLTTAQMWLRCDKRVIHMCCMFKLCKSLQHKKYSFLNHEIFGKTADGIVLFFVRLSAILSLSTITSSIDIPLL